MRVTHPGLAARVSLEELQAAVLPAGWHVLQLFAGRPVAGAALLAVMRKRSRWEIGSWLREAGFRQTHDNYGFQDVFSRPGLSWDIESHAEHLAGDSRRVYDVGRAGEAFAELGHQITREELRWLRLVYAVGIDKAKAGQLVGMPGQKWRRFDRALTAKVREICSGDAPGELARSLLASRIAGVACALSRRERRKRHCVTRSMKTSKHEGPAKSIPVGPKLPWGPAAERQIQLLVSA
jgi:hypothetical protein